MNWQRLTRDEAGAYFRRASRLWFAGAVGITALGLITGLGAPGAAEAFATLAGIQFAFTIGFAALARVGFVPPWPVPPGVVAEARRAAALERGRNR